MTSLKILDILSKTKNVTPTYLMSELNCTKSNITQRLNVMEKNGFIKRAVLNDPTDKRKIGVEITDLGKQIISETVNGMKKKGFEVEKKLGLKETAECNAFLKTINDLLDEYEHTK
jgi:DNA-binding MarR family transcriptional regulator